MKALDNLFWVFEDIQLADSFGANFHKAKFRASAAGVFIVKKEEFMKLNGGFVVAYMSMQYGTYNAYVLETFRPMSGATTVLTVLKSFGKMECA